MAIVSSPTNLYTTVIVVLQFADSTNYREG
jgi:hypothetical protein